MKRLSRIGNLILSGINRTSGGLGWLTWVSYVILVALVCANVIGRYVFSLPIMGTEDVSLLINVMIGWGAAALVLREGEHIEVHIITERLNPKKRALLKIITSFIGLFLCVIFAYSAWLIFVRSIAWHEGTETVEIAMSPWRGFMLVGVILLGLQFIPRAVNAFHDWRSLTEKAEDKGTPNG